MRRRTSHLQIRITEAERVALRRLAEAAGTTISAYVLSQALPRSSPEIGRLLAELPEAGPAQRARLQDLADLIDTLGPEEIGGVLPSGALAALPIHLANQVAALLERAAHLRGVAPPDPLAHVRPLDRPSFAWTLPSLRAHQLRVTPIAFKRRNLFFDPASNRALPRPLARAPGADPTREAPLPLGMPRDAAPFVEYLENAMAALELVLEFHLLGGAVIRSAFEARPGTARPTAQLSVSGAADRAIAELAEREGWPSDALPRALAEGAVGARGYLDLPHVKAFTPPPGYVLTLVLLGLGADASPRRLEDLRYVLRTLNLESASAALEVAARYVPERYLPSEAQATLLDLLGR